MNNNLSKTKHIIILTTKSVQLSLASTNKTSQSALKIRVNGNSGSLSLFSGSVVASALFTTGLFRSNWPTVSQIREKFLRILHHQHVTYQDITTHTPFIVVSKT